MHIGIITCIGELNYGQRLQNYAMEKLMEKLGCTVQTVNYFRPGTLIFLRVVKHTATLFLGINKPYELRLLKFDSFNKNFLHFTKKEYQNLDTDKFDFFVCGSDQIWNMNFSFNHTDLYFAQFAPKEKRISYAASMGNPEVPKEHLQKFKDGINGMASIAVREESAVKAIKELTGRDSVCTIDPTLMLSPDEWRKISKKPKIAPQEDKYILTYFLGEKSEKINSLINSVAEKYNLKVINLLSKKVKNFAGDDDKISYSYCPREFIWLVEHCKIMFTDSFHGCVFSAIFKKPFKWISRQEKDVPDMNSRMITLFEKLSLGDWCVGNADMPVDNNIFFSDYSKTDESIIKEQEHSYKYLKGALNIHEN